VQPRGRNKVREIQVSFEKRCRASTPFKHLGAERPSLAILVDLGAEFRLRPRIKLIVRTRSLCSWVAVTSVLQVALMVALATHTFLGYAQAGGLLHGDYGNHAHGSLVAIGLGSLMAAMCAIFLYLVHLASLGTRSLPSVARTLRAHLGWRTRSIIVLIASLLLFGMEAGEQLAAGRFDGALSAFGDIPVLGLGLIVLFSAAGSALLRALCDWLIDAHACIVSLISFLLRDRTAAGPLRTRFNGELLASIRYACDASPANGERAPPAFR
jgi:hypothetical protein